jgi:hypothetical protein
MLRLRKDVYLVAAPDGGALIDTRARTGRAGCLAIGAPAGRYLRLRVHAEGDHRSAAADVARAYGVGVDQVDADMACLLAELLKRGLVDAGAARRPRWRWLR